MSVTTWGVLGCADIARKNIRAMKLSANCELIAIASRNIEKAKSYAIENSLDLEKVALYGSYEELLSYERIDAVYIPLPTTLHLEWVTKAARMKKHILLEKPVAVTATEFESMIQVCKDNNVLLMDGTMFMHHTRLSSILHLLNDPFIGNIKQVRCSFSFNGNSESFLKGNIRTSSSGSTYIIYLKK